MQEDYGQSARAYVLPLCERCGERPAECNLVFTYRGEEFREHFYCNPCSDIAWEEGVAFVDAKAAQLAEIIPPQEG